MSDYQVIARKFRPQTFKDVVGQEAIVKTLKNGIKNKRLAQAYLFCGSRGTGKTTLARLFAKTLNCQHLTEDFEPCNQCSSCMEITSGHSLDVLEIDGASHRGIEDIRQINETVGYAATAGCFKIYLIDEVHMLTKEAFNALLKTLEEPPPKVKFFFATTEPHKVLPTILSRCQRFNLSRISLGNIAQKLRSITNNLQVSIEDEAITLLAKQADGGLRDAESLLDQMIAFEGNHITANSVHAILGTMPKQIYFQIDQAGHEGHFTQAFTIAHQIFQEGKDLSHFIEGLIEHIRQILLFKLAGSHSPLLQMTTNDQPLYAQSAHWYNQDQCLNLIEYLLEAQQRLRFAAFGKTALEAILLHVMRSHFTLSIEQLVHRLSDLEAQIAQSPMDLKPANAISEAPAVVEMVKQSPAPKASEPIVQAIPRPVSEPTEQAKSISQTQNLKVQQPPVSSAPPKQLKTNLFDASISEDPTPSPADFGRQIPKKPITVSPAPTAPLQNQTANQRPMHEYDTLFQFAVVELEGRLKKNSN